MARNYKIPKRVAALIEQTHHQPDTNTKFAWATSDPAARQRDEMRENAAALHEEIEKLKALLAKSREWEDAHTKFRVLLRNPRSISSYTLRLWRDNAPTEEIRQLAAWYLFNPETQPEIECLRRDWKPQWKRMFVEFERGRQMRGKRRQGGYTNPSAAYRMSSASSF